MAIQTLIQHYYGPNFGFHCVQHLLSPIVYITLFSCLETIVFVAVHGTYISKWSSYCTYNLPHFGYKLSKFDGWFCFVVNESWHTSITLQFVLIQKRVIYVLICMYLALWHGRDMRCAIRCYHLRQNFTEFFFLKREIFIFILLVDDWEFMLTMLCRLNAVDK